MAYGFRNDIQYFFPMHTGKFFIRAKAILNTATDCQYSNWMDFEFKPQKYKFIALHGSDEEIYNNKIREFAICSVVGHMYC